jgi:hypothetical protein
MILKMFGSILILMNSVFAIISLFDSKWGELSAYLFLIIAGLVLLLIDSEIEITKLRKSLEEKNEKQKTKK